MVGAGSNVPTRDRTTVVRGAGRCGLRAFGVLAVLLPLSGVLVQCGPGPGTNAVADNSQASSGQSFRDRTPPADSASFKDRFQAADAFIPRQANETNPNSRDDDASSACQGRVAGAAAPTPASGKQTRANHAGQPAIVRIPLSRQEPADG